METELQAIRIPPFPSRSLVIAASNMLKALGHDGFDSLRIDFDLLESDAGTGGSLQRRANSLVEFALKNGDIRTPDGMSLQQAMAVRAGEIYRSSTRNNIGDKEYEAFRIASEAGGSLNDVTQNGEDTFAVSEESGVFRRTPTLEQLVEQSYQAPATINPTKIFIVHGRDEAAEDKVARFVERLSFEAVILHERANQGQTVIEKFEANSDVGFAIVLLTPDDQGGLSGTNGHPRARQNVILEWGYFIGRLGRKRVLALKKGDVELPSDIHGLVWQEFDDHGGWKPKVAKELEAAGFKIDWSRASS